MRFRTPHVFRGKLAAWVPLLLVVALASPALGQVPSARDKETARTLFDKGVEAEKRGDLNQALIFFRDANQLVHVPSTALFLARVLERKGMLLEARTAALEAAHAPVQPNEQKFQSQCRADGALLAQSLEPRVPSVLVRVAGPAPQQVSLTIDGATIPPLASNPPHKLNPGAHTVLVQAPGFQPVELRVELREREAKTLDITLVPGGAPVVAPPPPTPMRQEEPNVGPLVMMGVGFGLGGAALITGAVTGGLSLAKAQDLEQACGGVACPPARSDEFDQAQTLATVADVTLIAGGVATLLGVGGLIWLAADDGTQVGLDLELGPLTASATWRF